MKAPNGKKIVGTLETMSGVACFDEAKIQGDEIVFEYNGDTRVDWNEQKTVRDKAGHRIFVDEAGFRWSEDEIIEALKRQEALKIK